MSHGNRSSQIRRRAAALKRPNLLERRMSAFLREPPSVRGATSVIITAIGLAVVVSGLLFRLLDHSEYPSIWKGMWLSIETVTTVGYGDVTPKNLSGRLIASAVMLQGISFVAIITAAVTSTFVARAQRERAEAEGKEGPMARHEVDERFNDVFERLDRVETMLRELGATGPRTPADPPA